MREFLKYVLWFLLILLSQVFFFDQLSWPGGFTLSFYIYFILIIPHNTNRIVLLMAAFAMGLAVDAFNDTFGLHASSALALGWIRFYIYKSFEPSVGYPENQTPVLSEMGWNWILKVYTLSILTFYTWFYMLSFLRLVGPWFTFQKIIISSISTLLIILVVQVLNQRRKNKNEL